MHAFPRLLFISQKIFPIFTINGVICLVTFFRITQMPASILLTCFVYVANNFLLVHCILIVVKGSVKCNFTVLKRLVDSFYAMRDAGLSKSRALVVWLLPSGYIYFYSYRGMMDHHTKTNCALKLRPALLVACVLHHYLRAT